MISCLNSLRLASWKIFQPLVAVPASVDSVISDLFVWRTSSSFKTYFELTSIPSLFDPHAISEQDVTIFFFDAFGQLISQTNLSIPPHTRQTLDIACYLPNGSGSLGTFAVFHSHTPNFVRSLGSFVSERGYVGYSYNSSTIVSYVHGNFDTIAYSADSSLEMLGSQSFRSRSYMLQHLLAPSFDYEIAIVNPTNSSQTVCCDVLTLTGCLIQTLTVSLQSRALHLFRISPTQEKIKVVLHSKLVMARPLVFRSSDAGLDVFHG